MSTNLSGPERVLLCAIFHPDVLVGERTRLKSLGAAELREVVRGPRPLAAHLAGQEFVRRTAGGASGRRQLADLATAVRAGPPGDSPAMVELLRRLDPLYRSLIRRYRWVDDPEGLFSEVLLRACRKVPDPDHRGLLRWLANSVRNAFVNAGVKDRNRVAGEAAWAEAQPDLVDEAPSPEAQASDAEQIRRLREAVLALPAGDRELIEGRYRRGLPWGAIERLTGTNRGRLPAVEREVLAKLRAALLGGEES